MLIIKALVPLAIALILSLVITFINYGITPDFLLNWLKGLVVAVIVIPIGLQLIPYMRRAVIAVIGNRSGLATKCIVAVCVSVTMEVLVSLAVTLAQKGLVAEWPLLWGLAFLKALPFGLAIGFSMTFVVHPWMQSMAITKRPKPMGSRAA